MNQKTPAALAIAGSDSSAGAGLQADLKTFSALGVYGATAVTAVTAQNTLGVTAVHQIPAAIIAAQIDAVFSDLDVRAVKTGMLGDEAAISAVEEGLVRWAKNIPVIVDPVMVSTTGSLLLAPGAERALVERLVPLAALITPNLHEAAAMLKSKAAETVDDMRRQAESLMACGPRAVLIKGGHGKGFEAPDLFFDGEAFRVYQTTWIETKNTHGTGCTLASAIAAFLIKDMPLTEAIASAKAYLQGALEHADALHIGRGAGPVSHFYRFF